MGWWDGDARLSNDSGIADAVARHGKASIDKYTYNQPSLFERLNAVHEDEKDEQEVVTKKCSCGVSIPDEWETCGRLDCYNA